MENAEKRLIFNFFENDRIHQYLPGRSLRKDFYKAVHAFIKSESPDDWGRGRFHPNRFIPFSGTDPDSKTGGGIQFRIHGLLPLWGHGSPGRIKRGFLSKEYFI